PPIEHDQIGPARPPTERPAQSDRVQVDQVQIGMVVVLQANQQIARVQILVCNAGVVETGHELAQGLGQALSQTDSSAGVKLRQRPLQKRIQRLRIVETVCQEIALAQ